MGVIKRQTLKTSLVNLAGFFIGAVSTLFIFTKIYTAVQIGQINYVQTTSLIVTAFASLGLSNLVIRFFPAFSGQEKHSGYLGLLISILVVGFGFFFVLSLLFSAYLPSNVLQFYPYIAVLSFIMGLRDLLVTYLQNFQRTTVPAVLDAFFLKIGFPVVAILYSFEWVDFRETLWIIIGLYGLVLVGLVCYIYKIGYLHLKFKWRFLLDQSHLIKEMFKYAGYGFIGMIGSMIVANVNALMISETLGFKENGIYFIGTIVANVIAIPNVPMVSLVAPVVGNYVLNENWNKVKDLYQRSSITLTILGVFILVGVCSNLDYIFEVMPQGEKYEAGKIVILFLGLTKVFDMSTSVNVRIVGFTKFYPIIFLGTLCAAGSTVLLNTAILPSYGIKGAAFVMMLISVLYNAFLVYFVWLKFKIQPFSLKTMTVAFLGVGIWWITYLIPDFGNPFVDAAVTSLLVTVLFVFSILKFQLSADLSEFYDQILRRIKNFRF